MNKSKAKFRATSLDEVLCETLKDKNAKELFDEYGRQLEISYQILQLRKAKKIAKRTWRKESAVHKAMWPD